MLSLPAALSLLACDDDGARYPHAADLRLPRPDDPVRWPIYPENPVVPADAASEPDGPLELFTWDSYVAPDVIRGFEREAGVEVRVSTFYDMNQAISKLRTGAVRPDVFVPTLEVLGRLVVAGLIQPLQHELLPNLGNVWPALRSPFYDIGSRYSVPYAVYSTGIGWRTDLVEDPAARPDPWSVFWDPAYRDKVYVLDDYRTGLQLPLLRYGADINTEDPGEIAAAGEGMLSMANATGVGWSLDDYTYLPEGRAWVHQAWSGDMAASPYYGPGSPEQNAATLGYWFPPDDRGEVNNDVLTIPAASRHPVLAHRFIDRLLDPDVAAENYAWVGYQQPLTGLTRAVGETLFPWLVEPSMSAAFVDEPQLLRGTRQLELSMIADALWQQAWLRFRSHG